MESSDLFQMLSSSSSSPSSAPPFSFVGISVLILIYVIILFLVMDSNEDNSGALSRVENCLSGLSLEEIQELPWFDCEVNFTAFCAVCLDGVQKGERCRIFPGCSHVFHAQCVDLWLARKPTCPTCRSPFKREGTLDAV